MSDLREAAQQALEALKRSRVFVTTREKIKHPEGTEWYDETITALRAALAQQEEPQTLDDALTLPRATAQAYENGYKAGVAHEREACAQVCEARFVGDLTREDMEARRCAAAIRARGVQL